MTKAVLVFLLAATAACHAQSTAPSLKGHVLGETLQQFMDKSNEITRQQMANCISTNGKDEHGDRTFECDDFLSARKTGSGHFDCTLPMYQTGVCRDFVGDATFSKGRLVEITVGDYDADWDDFLREAAAKFGVHFETKTDTVENAFGATYQLNSATWSTPQYIAIAHERFTEAGNKIYPELELIDLAYSTDQAAKKHHSSLD